MIDMARRAYGTGCIIEKHGAWYGRWRTPDGRMVTRKIGPRKEGRAEGLTQRQAEARLREMILTEAGAPVETDADALTVARLGELHVEHLTAMGRKKATLETVSNHHSKHIAPLLGRISVDQVDERDVQRLITKMLRGGSSPKTVRNVIGTLRSALGMVRRDNPCSLATLPKVRRSKKIRYLTREELERVLAAEPSDDDDLIIADFTATSGKWGGAKAVRDWWPVVRLLILTSAMSGMRLGELRGLRWRNLDVGAMKLRVDESFVRGQFDTPKSEGSSRAIPLAKRIMDELDEHHKRSAWNQDSDLVFAHPHTGRPLDRARLLQHVHAACRRAGVREVGIHDLRHTFGTTMAAAGVPQRTLQAWMGHADLSTTAIYTAYQPQPFENALVDQAFESPRTPFGPQFSTTTPHKDPQHAP